MAFLGTITQFSGVQISNGTENGENFNTATTLNPPTVTNAQQAKMQNMVISDPLLDPNAAATKIAPGTLVFNSDVDSVQAFQGKAWVSLGAGGGGANVTVTNGNANSTVIRSQANSAGIIFSLPATVGTANQILSTDGAGLQSWVNNPNFVGVTSAGNLLTDNIIVGNAGNKSVKDSGILINNIVIGVDLVANSIITGNANSTIQATTVQAVGGAISKLASISFPGVGAGNVGNIITIQAGGSTETYAMTLPLAQGAAGSTLINDGTGVLSWAAPNNLAAAGLYKIAATDANGNAATLALTVAPSGIISALTFEGEG